VSAALAVVLVAVGKLTRTLHVHREIRGILGSILGIKKRCQFVVWSGSVSVFRSPRVGMSVLALKLSCLYV
jgi:hypothetical protein